MWLGFIGVLAVAQTLQISIEVCPQPSRRAGHCPVRPEQTGCVTNSQCRPGFLCCLEGCGRQCKPALAVRTAARSGFCPVVPSPALVMCPPMKRECNMDTDCDDNRKCCFHPCGSRCMTSNPQSRLLKAGVCPIPPPRDSISCPGAISDKCDSDTDCTGTLKCCFHPCGRTCTNINSRTLLLKSGTCPMPSPVYCNLPRRDHCLSDADCPRLSKCCGHACGRSCVQAVPSRTRARAQSQTNIFCPPASPFVGLCVIGPNSCTADKNCGNGKICCSEGCGRECKTPLTNAQLCPTPPDPASTSCLAPVTDACQTNSACKEGQLCCKHPCGKRCQAPVSSGGYSCPVPASGFLVKCALNDKCLGDSACPGTKKCCKSPCGKYCADVVKTKTGTCPASNPKPLCKRMGDNCYKDGDCLGTHKCCKTSCGNRCLAPAVITRPGVCPVLPPGVVVRCALTPDTCTQDSECPGVQKCCKGPCSKSCKDTVKPKAGSCPTLPLGLVAKCAADTRDECSQDNHCSGAKKCCKGPCSKYCADPSTAAAKPGTCPTPPNPAVVLCALPITNQCTSDSQCSGDNKCCPHPCGKYCGLLNPKPKPGNCPKLPPSAFLVKCLSFDRCQNDGECPFIQKCCRQGCGNRCVDAESAEPPEPTKPVECLPYPCPGPCEYGVENDANGCPSCTCKPPPATEDPPQVTSKPGTCRNIRFKFRCRLRRDLCKNDSECRGNRKCCQLPCGKRCRRPRRGSRPLRREKRGQCPPKPKPLPCLVAQNDCDCDGDCPDAKKCCATECGIGCVNPNFYRG